MEQHPIPQDVTGFQFKLIGTMTVKQFGYIAVGAIFAVISWYAPLQGFFWQAITKGVLVPIFGLSGVIIAFVPIEGRPIDVMAVNFMHALLSPNQYVYIKKGRKFSFTQITYSKPLIQNTLIKTRVNVAGDSQKEERLHALLAESSYKDARGSLDQKERVFLQSIAPASNQYSVSQAKPGPVINAVSLNVSPKTFIPQPQVMSGQKTQASLMATAPSAIPNIAKQQTLSPKMQPASLPKRPAKPIPKIHFHMPASTVKSTTASLLSDTPNVIIGIVKDPRGNMLPNILAEVKDKDGLPVRAFKTNPLGQFASATALPDGEYTLELEDPKKKHAFEAIPISAKGQIMLPIEIISHDAREELRKALFN